jgi:hypothetical protein
MQELSLHILDTVQNSIMAGADRIEITIEEMKNKNTYKITIKDNGSGIDDSIISKITDPFTTTRTTRKVGMGLPLFKAAANAAGGDLTVRSKVGIGTIVEAVFMHNHIDRQPLGDMAQTIAILISSNANIDFVYKHKKDTAQFMLSTLQLREKLGYDIPLNNNDVIAWVKGYVEEGLKTIGVY